MFIGSRLLPQPPMPVPLPSPVNVEAHGLTDDNGDVVGLTYMRIADAKNANDAVEQTFPADLQVNVAALQLDDALPGRPYDINVAWADGSMFSATVNNVAGGDNETVDAPS